MSSFVPQTRSFGAAMVAVACLFALAAAPAQAKITSGVTVQPSGSGVRVSVNLNSSKSVAKKSRPTKVSVKAAGKTFKLTKIKNASATAGYASSWRSKVFTGSFAAKLNALNGKRVSVTLATKKSSKTSKSKVVVQTGGGGGGGGGSTVLFPPPPAPLQGTAAFDHLSKYLFNSAFSDCTGVWPTCAVEQRYVHCPDFSWQYHRNTPTGSGADIHAYDAFTVSGAEVFADGSWGVTYTTGTGGNYKWIVDIAGIARGEYAFGANYEVLGPMYWSQPAITWQAPGGAC